MKKYSLAISLILFVGFLSSCVTIGTFSYDRLQAGDINFPEQVRSVGIVNNMPPSGPVAEESPNLLAGDGKVMTESFAQAVAGTDYFDRVVVCDSINLVSLQTANGLDRFSPEQADSLMQALDVDMLFSLDRVFIQLKENSFFVPGLSVPVSVIDGVITPIIQAYIPGRHAPLFSVSKSDSIYWETEPSLNLQQIVSDASEFAATIPMKHLLPYWEEVQRYFYSGGCVEMRDAAVYVREGDWESAYQLWQTVYEQKKGTAKLQAAYNLALYHEMQDDFDQAAKYLNEAISGTKEGSAEKNMMEVYQIQLNDLAQKNGKLQMQMRRFDNNF